MSRAFVKEDTPEPAPPEFRLPPRGDSAYLPAAAVAMLEGARIGDTAAAELATGIAWGAPELVEYVTTIRQRAVDDGDDRLEQVASRYLRQAAANHREAR
jgi:hypothetical protein